MYEELKLKNLSMENLKSTFDFIQDKEHQRLFMMRGEPVWENHVNYFNKILNDKTQIVFAVYNNETHVGNCGLKNIENGIAELWIYIGCPYKGKGFGTNALNLLIKKAEKSGFEKLYLHVANFNPVAIKMYKKAGFFETEINEETKNAFGKNAENLIKMEINLTNKQNGG